MSTLIKTIILNNDTLNNFNGIGVLTLQKQDNGIYGTFKTYNLDKYNNLILGIAQNSKQIFKQSINLSNNNSYNFKLNNIDLNEPIACVLVIDNPDEIIPILWANEKQHLKNEIINNFNILKSEQSKNIKNEESKIITKKETLDLDEMFDISNQEEIENTISQTLEDKCIKECFDYDDVSNKLSNTLSQNVNPIEEELKNYNFDEETFYESMSEQIEDLFNEYPSETNLENLIPNSKWAKIDYNNDGNFYVLGLIYEDIELKYICYGVYGNYADNPPHGLENYSQFLPLDAQNPTDGYWVMYQNAISGESIEIEAI